MIKLTIR